jgi:hypothetical protein
MRALRRHHLPIVAALWAAGLGLAYAGFAGNAAALGEQRSPLDLFHLTIQLITLNSGTVDPPVPWPLAVARLLVPALTAYTLWQAIASIFSQQLVFLRLWRIRNHIVICGLSRKGWLLARGFLERGDPVVVIEEDEQHDLIPPCRERGAIVLVGDATDPETLRRAAVARARHVIAVTSDDGVNAEVALRCEALTPPRAVPLTCTVHLVDPQLTELARARELAAGDSPVRVVMFNTFDRGGQALWQRFKGKIAAPAGRAPHLLVIGLGRLGQSLVVHAVRDWAATAEGKKRGGQASKAHLRITAIDRDANWKVPAMRLRYPCLAEACDLAGKQMDVRGPEFARAEFLISGTKSDGSKNDGSTSDGPGCPAVDAVFVCFDDDSLSLRTALDVHDHLRRDCAQPVPVIVRMAETGGLSRLLDPQQDGNGVFANLHAFGLLDETSRPEVILGGADAD